MVTKGIRELFGDVLVDPELRAKLVESTEETIREGNYVLHDDEIAKVKEVVALADLEGLSVEELDERVALGPSPCCGSSPTG